MTSKTVTLGNVANEVEATNHTCGYLDVALGDPAELVYGAMSELRGLQFDTMVGRGLSGSLVVPILARAMNKYFAIVRKTGDGSHSARQIEGKLGKRWIFVDDLICTGDTFKKSIETINATKEHMVCAGIYLYGTAVTVSGGPLGRKFINEAECRSRFESVFPKEIV